MRVRDIMTVAVHTAERNTSIEGAAGLMTAKSVTALPVVDAGGVLVGMVSEGDLLWHRVPAEPVDAASAVRDTDPGPRPGTVGEVMTAYPLTTGPGTDVADVAEAMLDNDVRSMPVLDGGVVVGIVSRRDILRAMVRSDELLTREAQHRLDEYAAGRWTATVDNGVATVTGGYDNEIQREVVAVLTRTVPGVAALKLTTSVAS